MATALTTAEMIRQKLPRLEQGPWRRTLDYIHNLPETLKCND